MPGARTHWHRHPLGRTVFVTEGVGPCQRRGGPVVHVAIKEGDADHAVVHWRTPVTNQEYAAAPSVG